MPKDIIFGVNNITSASLFRTKKPCENFSAEASFGIYLEN